MNEEKELGTMAALEEKEQSEESRKELMRSLVHCRYCCFKF